MQADRLLRLEALVKFLALQHLLHRKLRRQADRVLVTQLAQPLAVVAHLGQLLDPES